MSATRQIKTTIGWEFSPDQVDGYGLKIIINKQEQPPVMLGPRSNIYEVQSELRGSDQGDRDHVVVFVAPFVNGKDGVPIYGQAHVIEFLTDDIRPPRPCGRPFIHAVSASLPVLPASSPEQKEIQPFKLMITGDKDVIDGSIVPITGVSGQGVVVTIPVDMLMPSARERVGNNTGMSIAYDVDGKPGVDLVVISPSDDRTVTLSDFVRESSPANAA